jgi:hypothetical protein
MELEKDIMMVAKWDFEVADSMGSDWAAQTAPQTVWRWADM